MQRTILGAKIHRATVTQADLHYVGSITIDRDLTTAAGLIEGEKVQVVDITNGSRIETYVIIGDTEHAGNGHICINGAAAHLVEPGDLVIIMSYLQATEEEAAAYEPRVIHVDGDNHIVGTGRDLAEAVPGVADQYSSRGI
ncbi:aspartate 1-decarboxylase [Corynebacterium neomassiliense]|uniref:aspartate 1-decarboxylase n=1 Tax=Corynebacterium neomassiliense TaxID=2079482 RepID=UPI001030ACD4|nr:aspartate 1-decarboxylase [Corynebacterium neomassiliense]